MTPRSTSERSVGLFILGLVAFSPPFLLIFNVNATVLGLPLLYIYLFAAWAVLIVLVARVAERSRPNTGPREPGRRRVRTEAGSDLPARGER